MTTLPPEIQNLKSLGEEVERLRQEMAKVAEVAVKEGAQAIFAEYGDILHEFGWTHHAPNNNDGDPTEAYISELVIISKLDVKKAVEEDGMDEEDAISEFWSEGDSSPAFGGWRGDPIDERHAQAKEAAEVIHCVMDTRLVTDLFGEYKKVIFNAEGVDVEDYWDEW